MNDAYFEQTNFLPQQTSIVWDTKGFPGFGLDVTGSFTAGNFVVKGSNDGVNWYQLQTANGFTIMTNPIISEVGHYTFLAYGYAMAKVFPSGDISALTLTALGSSQIPPVFTF